jgi:hypothetical protein
MPQLQLSDEDVEALVRFLLAPQSPTSMVDSTRGSE